MASASRSNGWSLSGSRERLGQDLDGDVAIERCVVCLPGNAHPALADLHGQEVKVELGVRLDRQVRLFVG
jgi:hypothetical protein